MPRRHSRPAPSGKPASVSQRAMIFRTYGSSSTTRIAAADALSVGSVHSARHNVLLSKSSRIVDSRTAGSTGFCTTHRPAVSAESSFAKPES